MLKTHKKGLNNNAITCSFVLFPVLFSVLNSFRVVWLNSFSPISDGESQITKYIKKDSTTVTTPGVTKAADQP